MTRSYINLKKLTKTCNLITIVFANKINKN